MAASVIEWIPATADDVSVDGLSTGAPPSGTWEATQNAQSLTIYAATLADQPFAGAGLARKLGWTPVAGAMPFDTVVTYPDFSNTTLVEAHGVGTWGAFCWFRPSGSSCTSVTIRLTMNAGGPFDYTVTSPVDGAWTPLFVSGAAGATVTTIGMQIRAVVGSTPGLYVIHGMAAGRVVDFADKNVIQHPRRPRREQQVSLAGVVQTDFYSAVRSFAMRSNDLSYNVGLNAVDFASFAFRGGVWTYAHDRLDRAKDWYRRLVFGSGQTEEPIEHPQGPERYRVVISDAVESPDPAVVGA